MINIYMARHGQDEDNIKGILNGRRDQSLTKNGINQAKHVASKIAKANIKFDKIYSSPLKRALKTAEIISETTNSPSPIIMDELIEREFGIMTGKQHSDIIKLCSPHILQSKDITYFLNPEGAETFPELIERSHKIIKKLQDENDEGNVLIVTHGDIGKMIYATFYNLDWKKTLQQFYFGNADLLLLSKDSSPENTHVFKITNSQTKNQMSKD